MSSDIQNARTALLLPPLSFLGNSPFLTLTAGIIEKNILLTYPISLYSREEHGKMNWLGFVYTFLFTGKNGERCASITYPLCFNESCKNEIFERLFKEVEELAAAFKAKQILYEGYQNVRGELFNPTSGIGFGNIWNRDFLDFIKKKGFVETRTTSTYEIEWLSDLKSSRDICAYTVSGIDQRRRHYLELCSACDSFLQLFDLESVMARPLNACEMFYFREEWIVFTERGSERGCLRWFPQFIFTEEMKREAKIARLLFDDAALEFMWASVAETMNRICASGMNRIQIADIPRGSLIESNLESLGGFKICETVLMVRPMTR